MPILDSMLKRFGYVKKESIGTSLIAASSQALGMSPRPDVTNMGEYLSRYADQAWVNSCVRILASKFAGVPLNIYRRTGKDLEELPAHPVKKLIDDVNDFSCRYDLMETTMGFLSLTGVAYWLLDRYVGGKPTAIFPLKPSRVRVKTDSKKFISGYVYQTTEGIDGPTLPPETVVRFSTWNPLNEWYGLPSISAARDASDSLMLSDRYNKSFFNNSAMPGGVLATEQQLDQSVVDRIRAGWQKTHSGINKAHGVAILDAGLKWTPTSITHQDMQFSELKRMTREDILTVFGVPPVMVGVFDYANYANAREQRKIFWQDTMIPWLSKFLSVINEHFVKPYDQSVEAAFDLSGVEELQEDKKIQAEEHEILVRSGIMTINEARTIRKLPPVEWGDTWNAPIGLMPITEDRPQTPMPSEDPSAAGPGDEEDPQQDESGGTEVPESDEQDGSGKTVECAEQKGAVRRDIVWAGFKSGLDANERRFKAVMVRLFTDQEREVIQNLRDHWEDASRQARLDGMKSLFGVIDVVLFDGKYARKVFRKQGEVLMTFVFEQSAKNEADRYGLGSFDILDPKVQKWIDEKAFKFADEVNRASEEQIRDALTEGVKAGESIGDITKRIESIFDHARGYRSERVARTEVVSASNAGAFASYEQSGAVQETEWVSSRDGDVRETHQIDGQRSGLNIPFSNGLRYPGDPNGAPGEVINCRCTVAPVVGR